MRILKNFLEKNKKEIILFITFIVVFICSFGIKYLLDKEARSHSLNKPIIAKIQENPLGKNENVYIREINVKPIENLEDDIIPQDEIVSSKTVDISSLDIKDEKGKAKTLVGTSKNSLKNTLVYINDRQYKIDLSKDNVLILQSYNFQKNYVLGLDGNKVIIYKKDDKGNLSVEKTYEKRLIREEVTPLFAEYKLQVNSLSEVKDYLSTVTS